MLLTLSGCNANKDNNSESLKESANVEIKEYEGKDLSSILAFRENSIEGPQYVNISKYPLKIDGLVEMPVNLKYDEALAKTKYTKLVRLNCVEGWSVDILWEGILIEDLLKDVKVQNKANTVIFYAVDGYSTSLPLATIIDKNMIIAYKMNGLVLPPERSYPF